MCAHPPKIMIERGNKPQITQPTVARKVMGRNKRAMIIPVVR
jgi:hypothetical protein